MTDAVVTQLEAALRRLAEDESTSTAIEVVAALYSISRQCERIANELTALSYRGSNT